MRLIALAGKARVGKDTVAEMLSHEGFVRYAFAMPIKQAVQVMFGLSHEHTDGARKEEVLPWLGRSPRYLMQTLGTEWGRQRVAEDVWLRLAQQRLNWLRERGRAGMVISDCRFENEAAWVREQGGEVWHIQRPDAQRVEAHASEAGVTVRAQDRVIVNAGTVGQLAAQVRDMLQGEAA